VPHFGEQGIDEHNGIERLSGRFARRASSITPSVTNNLADQAWLTST
jgi:hypothetical protein